MSGRRLIWLYAEKNLWSPFRSFAGHSVKLCILAMATVVKNVTHLTALNRMFMESKNV